MRCKTCKYWVPEEKTSGSCSCDKFVYTGEGAETPIDGLGFWDVDSCSAAFETGENFGCLHYEKKQEVNP
jgi:hypothetical protein